MPKQTYQNRIWETVPAGQRGEAYRRRLAFLLGHLRGGEQVLDLGCGEAHFLQELIDRGFAAVGCDVASLPLRRAAARRGDLPLVQVEEGKEWPFEVAAFDVVWCSEVIEHVLDTEAFLSELRRVLRSGGLLLLTTPNHNRLRLLSCALSPRRFAAAFDVRSDHIRFFNALALHRLLADFGFQEISIAGRWQGRLYLSARRSRF